MATQAIVQNAAVQAPNFGGLLGSVFDNVDTVIQNTLNQAHQIGFELILTTGKEIENAIENARAAYEEELNRTEEQLSDLARKVLNDLRAMEQEFINATEEQLNALRGRATTLVQGLPFASQQPIIHRNLPNYLLADRVNTLTFEGGFAGINPTALPTLTLGGQPCTLVQNNNQTLRFEIPAGVFPQGELHSYSHLSTGELTVKWLKPRWIWWSEEKTSVYRVALNALPASPGHIVANYTSTVTRTEPRSTRSIDYSLHGLNYNGTGLKWKDMNYPILPTPGWRINTREPVQVVKTYFGNSHVAEVTNISATGANLHLGVNVHNSHNNNNGYVTAHVTFTEEHDIVTHPPRTEDHSTMRWGDQQLLTPQENEEFQSLTVNGYDGAKREMGPVPSNDFYVRLNPAGDSWQITAVPPTGQ